MNFEEAVQAHVEWKTKLRAYLTKHDGSLKPAQIALDNQCALGKWIYGEAQKYKHIPEFATLKSEHAKFHQYTAQIVELVNTGEVKEAEAMLQAGSDYMKLSGSCVSLILQIKTKATA